MRHTQEFEMIFYLYDNGLRAILLACHIMNGECKTRYPQIGSTRRNFDSIEKDSYSANKLNNIIAKLCRNIIP